MAGPIAAGAGAAAGRVGAAAAGRQLAPPAAGQPGGGNPGGGGAPPDGHEFPLPGGDDNRRRSGRVAAGGGALALLAAILLLLGLPAILVGTGVICSTSTAGGAAGVADPPDLSAVEIAERIYDVAVEMQMSERHLISAYITVLVESGGGVTMRNLACARPGECDGDSVGAFQQRNLPEWTKNGRDRRNVSDAARSYFEAVYRYQRPGMSAGEIAVAVQRMAAQYAGRYLTAAVEQRAYHFLQLVLERKRAAASGLQPTDGGERASRTFVVGDSLGVGTMPYLRRMTGGRIRGNSVVGRSSAAGLTPLRQALAQDPRIAIVVLDVGTNDSNAARLKSTVREARRLAPNAELYVPELRGGPAASAKNAMLSREDVTVIGWRTPMAPDGLHPADYESRAQQLFRALRLDGDDVGGGTRLMRSPVATAAANFTSDDTARLRAAALKVEADAAGNMTERFQWPTDARTITSPYGMRIHPITGVARMHTGVDIGAPAGAEIHAVLSGIVVLAQSEAASNGYGNFVCVRHSQQLTTCYAHMQSVPTLTVGSPVAQGTTVGRVGSTGQSTAPHLHFEVRLGPTGSSPTTDPAPYLNGAASFSGNNGGMDDIAANACLNTGGTPAARAGHYQGGELAWPLQGGGGTLGQGSHQAGGTHDPASPPNNWQSDNALDIATPIGTPVIAVADGEVCATCGFGALASNDARMAGLRLTLNVAGNQIYYAHLSRFAPGIAPGTRVKKGDVLGFSGAAGGPPPVPHLHIGVANGRPEDLFGVSNV